MASSHQSLKFVEAATNTRELLYRQAVLITEGAVGPLESGEDQEARATHKKGKKQGVGQKWKDGFSDGGGEKARGAGQAFNGFHRRTGLRKRCYRRDSVYRLAPRRPRRDTPRGDRSPPPQERGKA